MPIIVGMNETLQFSYFRSTDLPLLLAYLEHLSPATRKRFGPHAFDAASIAQFYADPFAVWGFIAKAEGKIIAYAVVKPGGLEHETPRLHGYGLQVHPLYDCAFAPSVADGWQGRGVGVDFFHFIRSELNQKGVKRMILWGGVQADNEPALRFYAKLGFQRLGYFEHEGGNWDMCLEW